LAQDLVVTSVSLQNSTNDTISCNKSSVVPPTALAKSNLFGQTELRPYHLTRFEGLSTGKAITQTGKYLKKYKRKRFNYEHATTHYFDCKEHPIPLIRVSPDSGTAISLAITGDMMWIGKAAPGYVCEKVLDYLGSFDLVFGNLESPIDTTRRAPNALPDYLTYNSNAELLTSFHNPKTRRNLFDVVSLANNHAFDRHAQGLLNTIELLDRLGIAYSGASIPDVHHKYICIERNGIKIGIYAATYGLNFEKRYDPTKVQVKQLSGLAPPEPGKTDLEEIKSVLTEMEHDKMDLKMISLHWGYEFELFPDPLVQEVARRIVIAGADILVGSHPHLFQPVETYYINNYNDGLEEENPCPIRLTDTTGIARKAAVFYSLGNFVTRMYSPLCQTGVIASIDVFKENTAGKTDWSFNEMAFVYNHVPFFPGRKHKLMFLSDYHDKQFHRLSKKRQKRLIEETGFARKHITN
jgi:poly-gamma-glutamate capsule biosynthesis protein CapA/YwtB (metallophosphatase superfamily)